jgi:PAS domain S-box-containing protein
MGNDFLQRKSILDSKQELRDIAEKKVCEKEANSLPNLDAMTLLQTQQMLHELRVHQIELEMQNEELRRVQVELDVARRRYFDLYELAPAGYFTLSDKGIITEANLTMASLIGIARNQIQKQPLSKYILKEDQASYYAHRKHIFETGEPQEFEVRLVKENGDVFWAYFTATLTEDHDGIRASRIVVTDISQQKQVENNLTESEERYRILFEYAGVGIEYYKPDGMIISFNNKAAEKVGGRSEDFSGKFIYEVFPKQEADLYMHRIIKAVLSDELQEYEDHALSNHTQKWQFSTYSRVIDHDGNIAGVQIISQDITNRKNNELELLRAKEVAVIANEAKSQFLANMSHEIRTPLHSIMGVQQILEMTKLTDEQREYITIAKTASKSLMEVLNDILDYSKLETGKMELEKNDFCLEELISESATLFQLSAAKKGIRIETNYSKEIPRWVNGDGFRLRQILTNLIGNAIKFTPNGEVSIFVKKIAEFNHHNIKLEFSVKDTGIGIATDKMDRLFRCFSQVDNSNTREYGGTGLGLSICKGLVEQMNGDIWFESIQGGGSTFYFTCVLEMCDEGDVQSCEPQMLIVDVKQNRPLKILLVEDEEGNRLIVNKFTENMHWQLTSVENGKQAVDLLEKTSFDLILMDIQMPIMDGYTATQIIRKMEVSKHTPIIAMTAFALKRDSDKCLEIGIDDYLLKPVAVQDFYEMIEKWTK